MIVEHEFLEQVAEAGFAWSLTRCIEFLDHHKDPWLVLRALYQSKCIEFVEENGNSLPAWKAEEKLKNRVGEYYSLIFELIALWHVFFMLIFIKQVHYSAYPSKTSHTHSPD